MDPNPQPAKRLRFDDDGESAVVKRTIELPDYDAHRDGDSECTYYPGLIPADKHVVFVKAARRLPWEQLNIVVYGKRCKQNRFCCLVKFDPRRLLKYRYSGTDQEAIEAIGNPDLAWMVEMRDLVADTLGVPRWHLNICLCNKYRPEHNIGKHSDDEKDLRKGSVIASVSIGEAGSTSGTRPRARRSG